MYQQPLCRRAPKLLYVEPCFQCPHTHIIKCYGAEHDQNIAPHVAHETSVRYSIITLIALQNARFVFQMEIAGWWTALSSDVNPIKTRWLLCVRIKCMQIQMNLAADRTARISSRNILCLQSFHKSNMKSVQPNFLSGGITWTAWRRASNSHSLRIT